MYITKKVTNHISDVFSNTVGKCNTGWEAELWCRVFQKTETSKVEFLKGNKTVLTNT